MSVISSLRLWRPLANISCQNGFIVIGRKYSTDLGRYVKIVFYHKTLYPLDFDIIHIILGRLHICQVDINIH